MDQGGCSSRDHKMDSSTKEQFVLVQFPEADEGSEYEIVSKNQLNVDSRETLESGDEVSIKFGFAKGQAYVVLVSDEYRFLENNLKCMSKQCRGHCKKTTPLPSTPRRKHHRNVEYNKTHVIKVMDKGIQTEPDAMLEELRNEHESLKAKHDALLQVLENLKGGLKKSLEMAEAHVDSPSASVSDIKKNGTVLKTQTQNVEVKQTHKMEVQKREEKEECVTPNGKQMVYIGSHGTAVSKEVYDNVYWLNHSAAVRTLLTSVFSRKVLATHSLTGKPSPAFINAGKQVKKKLDEDKVADIVEVVSYHSKVKPSIVRGYITTKCADENKMYKKRMAIHDKENSAHKIKKRRTSELV